MLCPGGTQEKSYPSHTHAPTLIPYMFLSLLWWLNRARDLGHLPLPCFFSFSSLSLLCKHCLLWVQQLSALYLMPARTYVLLNILPKNATCLSVQSSHFKELCGTFWCGYLEETWSCYMRELSEYLVLPAQTKLCPPCSYWMVYKKNVVRVSQQKPRESLV